MKEHTELTSTAIPDVDGMLSDGEGRFLQLLADSKFVLEIGSYKGRSTIWMAKSATMVYAVDPFEHMTEFQVNLERHKVDRRVVAIQGFSPGAINNRLDERIEFVFIDGDHSEKAVRADIDAVLPRMTKWGYIAFHDYGREGDAGVKKAVDDFIADGAVMMAQVGTVAVVKPFFGPRKKAENGKDCEVSVKPVGMRI